MAFIFASVNSVLLMKGGKRGFLGGAHSQEAQHASRWTTSGSIDTQRRASCAGGFHATRMLDLCSPRSSSACMRPWSSNGGCWSSRHWPRGSNRSASGEATAIDP